jgi:hypothetical protein
MLAEITSPTAPAKRLAGLRPFEPGRVKTGGRKKGTPNRNRTVTIERIIKLADPIGALCRIANGEPSKVAPEPGKPAELMYPTMTDRLQALKVLAAKVLPDLKQVAVEDGGRMVSVVMQIGQKVTVPGAGEPAAE